MSVSVSFLLAKSLLNSLRSAISNRPFLNGRFSRELRPIFLVLAQNYFTRHTIYLFKGVCKRLHSAIKRQFSIRRCMLTPPVGPPDVDVRAIKIYSTLFCLRAKELLSINHAKNSIATNFTGFRKHNLTSSIMNAHQQEWGSHLQLW